jgi:hypothetical protein
MVSVLSKGLQLGEDFTLVYVTAVEHPEHFWMQVLSNKSTQLDTLLQQMTEFYGTKNLVNKLFCVFFLHL